MNNRIKGIIMIVIGIILAIVYVAWNIFPIYPILDCNNFTYSIWSVPLSEKLNN